MTRILTVAWPCRKDLARLATLFDLSFPNDNWTAAKLAGLLTYPENHIRVLRGPGFLGGAVLTRETTTWRLLNLAIVPEHRREGLGRLFVEILLKGPPLRRLGCEAFAEGPYARAFLLACGFTGDDEMRRPA